MLKFDEIRQCAKYFVENIPEQEKRKNLYIVCVVTTKHHSEDPERIKHEIAIDMSDTENYGLKPFFCTHQEKFCTPDFDGAVDKQGVYDTEFLVCEKNWKDVDFIPISEIAKIRFHIIM